MPIQRLMTAWRGFLQRHRLTRHLLWVLLIKLTLLLALKQLYFSPDPHAPSAPLAEHLLGPTPSLTQEPNHD